MSTHLAGILALERQTEGLFAETMADRQKLARGAGPGI